MISCSMVSFHKVIYLPTLSYVLRWISVGCSFVLGPARSCREAKKIKNAITAAGDAIAQGKIPNIEAQAWKSILESLSRDENGDTRTLARNMSVNESIRKDGYGLATAESFNDWRGRGCSKVVPVLGRDGTKIAPPGDLFDQPLGEMS